METRFSRLAYAAILALTVALALPFTAAGAETTGGVSVVAARVAAEQQLISLGINPGSAVFQVGARNYAGPDCPGSGWNCTSASMVVQIAAGAALTATNNFFQCSDPMCVIVQPASGNPTGGTNEARCVQNTSADAATQQCTIRQTNTSGTNRAIVFQTIHSSLPQGSQDAGQRATVNQTNGTGTNQSSIAQTIAQGQAFDLRGAGPVSQSQEAHQRADVCQGGANPCTASSSGANTSNIAQSNVQRLRVHFGPSSSGTITQMQNTGTSGNGRAIAGTPKSTAVVAQKSSHNTNTSGLLHFNRQVASVDDRDGDNENGDNGNGDSDDQIMFPAAFNGTVVQQQGISGNPVCPDGGLCGYVAQRSTGVQRAHERQDELQKVQGPPGARQSQFGPEFCCAIQTGGNPNNVNTISQVKVQLHTGTITDGKIQGHCVSSPNGCRVQQTLRQNNTTKTNSCSGASCNPTIECLTAPTEGGGQSTVCTPGTATGPLPPPCPSPACSATITRAAPLLFEERSANV